MRLNFLRSSSAVNVIGFLITTGLQFLLYPVLINALGKQTFGLYIYYTAIAGIMYALDLSVLSGMVHYFSFDLQNSDIKSAAFVFKTSVFFYAVLLSLICIVSYFYLDGFLDLFQFKIVGFDIICSVLVVLQFSLTFYYTVLFSIFKCFGRFDIFNILSVSGFVFNYGVMALSVSLGADLLESVAYSTICLMLYIPFAYIYTVKFLKRYNIDVINARFSWPVLKKIVAYSYVLSINSFAGIFFTQIQRLFIGHKLGPDGVGSYQIVYSLVSKVHSLLNAFFEILFPWASANKNSSDVFAMYAKNLGVSFMISAIFMTILIIFGGSFISIWLQRSPSPDVLEAVLPLSIAFLFVCCSIVPFYIANALGLAVYNLYYGIFNVALYLSFYVLFVSNIATLNQMCTVYMASNAVSGILFQLIIYRKIKIRTSIPVVTVS